MITAKDLPACDGKTGWPWADAPPLVPAVRLDASAPKLTVVTPSYNQAEFLEATIRSVLLQNYPNLEYIVMDGGSTDGSLDIIRSYEPYLHAWSSAPDAGQADAINKGFAKGSGTAFAWINSDDYYLPGALPHLVRGLLDDGADLANGDVWQAIGHAAPAPWRPGAAMDLAESLQTLNVPVPQQGAIWTRALWERVGGLDVQWMCVLDRDFFVRSALAHRFLYLPGPVAVSRVHPSAKSTALAARWIEEMPRMYRAFFQRPDLPTAIRALRTTCLYAVQQRCAETARRCGRSPWRSLLAAGWASPARFARDELRHLARGRS